VNTRVTTWVTTPPLTAIASVFLRRGNLTFGSGNTTTALLRRDLVEDRKWLGPNQFALCYTLARVTPGTNLLAMCAALGWYLRGWPGAILALLAASIPASILTLLLTFLYEIAVRSPAGVAAVGGAVASVAGIIAGGAWLLVRPGMTSGNRLRAIVLVVGAAILSREFHITPLSVLCVAAVIGWFWPEKNA
jgi:chromate transporter